MDSQSKDAERTGPDSQSSSRHSARYDALRELADRHEAGELSDSEYRREKRRILRGGDLPENKQIEIIVATYSDEFEAEAALNHLRALQRDSAMDVIDAAVIIKRASGKVELIEVRDLTNVSGQPRGGIAGLIYPPTEPEAATVASAIGAALGLWTDQGFRTADLQLIGERLRLGHSAIVAVVRNWTVDHIAQGLAGFKTFTRHTLSVDIARAVADVDSPPDARAC